MLDRGNIQTSEALVSIESLRVEFDTDGGVVVGVEDVSFSIMPRETVCVVGEFGVREIRHFAVVDEAGGVRRRAGSPGAACGSPDRTAKSSISPGPIPISCAEFGAMKSA